MNRITEQEFKKHITQAQQAAEKAPVFIVNNGEPTQVLISYTKYQRLITQGQTVKQNAWDALTAYPEINAAMEEIELELPPRTKEQRLSVDFED